MEIPYYSALALVATGLLVALSASIPDAGQNKVAVKDRARPNIVVVLADDMGFGDVQSNNPKAQTTTPHLNQLGQEGLRFTDVHSGSSVCTPTRYGLITGRYAFRSSLKKGVLNGYSPALIEADRFTIADLMKQAGYQTAVIGKWHLGLSWSGQNNQTADENINVRASLALGPNNLEFDYSYIVPASLDMPPYIYLENGAITDRTLVNIAGNKEPRGVFWRPGKASKSFDLESALNQINSKAQDYLENVGKAKTPFFLYLPLPSPHTPWLPGKSFKGTSSAGLYGDYVAHTDNVVQRVLNALDRLGLKENTLVIFTSDNGADWKPDDLKKFPRHQANYIYRGEKSDIWEGGHRVPFLVRWPEAIKTARTVNQTICLTDLMATFASLTRQSLPANSGQDSFNFSSLLTDQPSGNVIRESTIHHSIDGMFAIRKGKWKYVDGAGSGGWSADESATKNFPAQLYDLDSDPKETTNLLKSQTVMVNELKALLQKQQSQGYTRPGARQ